MDISEKIKLMENAKSLYLAYVKERWTLIHYMLIAYPALWGGFGLYKGDSKSYLPIVFLLT